MKRLGTVVLLPKRLFRAWKPTQTLDHLLAVPNNCCLPTATYACRCWVYLVSQTEIAQQQAGFRGFEQFELPFASQQRATSPPNIPNPRLCPQRPGKPPTSHDEMSQCKRESGRRMPTKWNRERTITRSTRLNRVVGLVDVN